MDRTCSVVIIHILLIDFHAVTHPAGNRVVDGVHVLRSDLISVYEHDKKHIVKGIHGLYSGIILEPNIAARALRMHGSVTIVLLERTRVRECPVTNAAGKGCRSNWAMDGGGVLWHISTCE